jgi:Ca-activated chloride channel family protein
MLRITSPFLALLFLLLSALLLASCSTQEVSSSSDSMTVRSGDIAAPAAAADTTASFAMSEESDGDAFAAIAENDFVDASSEPLSTFGVDVDAASYSIARRMLQSGSLPSPDAVRVEEFINYFTYDYPQPTEEHPFSVTTEIAECPWNPSHRLMHVGLQGRRLESEQVPPSNLVFLVDVSGSMNSPDRLPLLQRALHLLVDQLTERDRVAIVTYAGSAGVALTSTSGAAKETIHDAIDELSAGGSTAGAAGIAGAYEIAHAGFIRGGNNRVILATDGDFNVGVSSDDELVRIIEAKREGGVSLTVLGFGMGNLKDARMEKLADHGNGHYAYIDSEAEAKRVFMTEITGTLFTIAKDAKVQVVFNPAKVKSYRLVGYENRVLAARDFDDDAKDAGDIGAGHSVTALYEIVPTDAVAGVDRKGLDTLDLPSEFWREQTAQIRLRYKQPDGATSRLLSASAIDRGTRADAASETFRFSAAVAEFGMLLRGSRHAGDGSFDHVHALASTAVGADLDGYRKEFLDLVEAAGELMR